MAAYAIPADVEAIWRPLSEEQATQAAVLLDYASARIRHEFPDVDDRLASDELDPTLPVMVAAGMVKRAMIGSATEGLESQSQGAGPFQMSQNFANPMGNLYLTADDRRLLAGPVRRRTAFSVDLIADVPDVWF